MKRLLGTSFVCAALVAAAALAAPLLYAQTPAGVAGQWDVTINSPQGTNQALLTVKQDGGKVTGTWKGQMGEAPLETVTLDGNNVKFSMKRNMQGQEMVFTYTGALDKGALKGSVDFGGMATGDWSAVRHSATAAAAVPAAPAAPAAAPAASAAASGPVDVSGTWTFAVETSAGSGTPTVVLKQEGEKVSGTYKSQTFGDNAITGTVVGGELKFSFTADAQGQKINVTYTGKVKAKDTMEGTAQLGELGEGKWTAKKQ